MLISNYKALKFGLRIQEKLPGQKQPFKFAVGRLAD